MIKEGVHKELPFDVYLAMDEVNIHSLVNLLKSPKHYTQSKSGFNKEPTSAMKLGTACHLAVIEPDLASKLIVEQLACDRRTKEGKAVYSEWLSSLPENALVFDKDDYNKIYAIKESVLSNKIGKKLFTSEGDNEATMVFTLSDVRCKARADRLLHPPLPIIVDLKTAHSASQHDFIKSCVNFNYHLQAAFYLEGAKALGLDVEYFLFCVVENTPPYAVATYEIDQPMLDHAKKQVYDLLDQYKRVQDWTAGYPEEVKQLHFPAWAFKSC
jgi:hypothetical protein